MSEVSVIGLDLAKHVFQVHWVDAASETAAARSARTLPGRGRSAQAATTQASRWGRASGPRARSA